jgi:hypothetical protein
LRDDDDGGDEDDVGSIAWCLERDGWHGGTAARRRSGSPHQPAATNSKIEKASKVDREQVIKVEGADSV